MEGTATQAPPTFEDVRRAPKVLLHDHLDGGLRPATIVELAAECGHQLPEGEPEALGRWFEAAANSTIVAGRSPPSRWSCSRTLGARRTSSNVGMASIPPS